MRNTESLETVTFSLGTLLKMGLQWGTGADSEMQNQRLSLAGVGQNIAMLAPPTARNLFLIYIFRTRSTLFFQILAALFSALGVANAISLGGPWNRPPCLSSNVIDAGALVKGPRSRNWLLRNMRFCASI